MRIHTICHNVAMDLKSYYAEMKPAQKTMFRGADVYTTHPPSAGGALLGVMLNILDGYPVSSGDAGRNASVLEYHRYIEVENVFRQRPVL